MAWRHANRRNLAAFVSVLLVLAGLTLLVSPALEARTLTLGFLHRVLGVEELHDEGTCHVWMRNLDHPTSVTNRTFRCYVAYGFAGFHGDTVVLHRYLYDEEKHEVFTVPGMKHGRLEEWFPVDATMYTPHALRYRLPSGADAGTFTVPAGARGNATVGWVTSGGEENGTPRLKFLRTFHEDGSANLDGVHADRWWNVTRNRTVTWHGLHQIRSESNVLWVDPRSGLLLNLSFHVVSRMTPDQIAEAQGAPASPLPPTGPPQKVFDLRYNSSPTSVREHAAGVQRWHRVQGFFEPPIYAPLAFLVLGGVGLAWWWREGRRGA